MTRVQINLDQCTGKFVMDLRAASLTVEHSFERLEAYRVATIEVCLAPPACPAAMQLYKTGATLEKLIQEAAKAVWESDSLIWKAELWNRCKIPFTTRTGKFPSYDYPVVDPNAGIFDLKGTRFLMGKPEPIELKLHYRNLTSAAQLKKDGLNDWSIHWTE